MNHRIPKVNCGSHSAKFFLPSLFQGIRLLDTESRTFPARSPKRPIKGVEELIQGENLMPQIPHAQLATTQISVINESTVLTDAEVTPVVIALQQQVTNDFRPIWGIRRRTQDGSPGYAGAARNLVAGNSRRLRSGRRTGLPRPDSGRIAHGQGIRRQRSEGWRLHGASPPATNCWKCWPIPTSTSPCSCRMTNTDRNALRLRGLRRLRRRQLRLQDQRRSGLGLCLSGMV